MATVETDAEQHILAQDPGHIAWIDGISQSCGLERYSTGHPEGVRMDAYTRVWTFVWLPKDPQTGAGAANYGVRITEYGRRFSCVVRGPQGHVSLEHWFWFPAPDQIITMAMLAGFDWA